MIIKNTIANNATTEEVKFFKELTDNRNLVFFGGGSFCKIAIEYFSSNGIKAKYIIDNNSQKWGMKINDIPIVSPEYLNKDQMYVIITSMQPREISEQLESFNFNDKLDYLYYYNYLSLEDQSKTSQIDKILPPKELAAFIGHSDFEVGGKDFVRELIEFGKLKPNETILDVGCGIGRAAIPLTEYLTNGIYEGFDIAEFCINWCQSKITSKYPNFKFKWANIFNSIYNYKGKEKADKYKFPYNDNTFDFVFLNSVFTHMLSKDVENYLSEISRVLKKDGRCFISYFLLDSISSSLMINDSTGCYGMFQYKIVNA